MAYILWKNSSHTQVPKLLNVPVISLSYMYSLKTHVNVKVKPHPAEQLPENVEVLPEILPVHKDPAGGSVWERHDEIGGAKFGIV